MVSQSSSVGYTIMGKTADLTVVQQTTIDILHKEGKTQNNNNLLHLYSAFLDTQRTPERPPHTSLLVERRQSDEANQ